MDFDYNKFKQLKEMLKRAQFVPMDPSMAGGDPAAGGMPPPGDPSAMGALPPEDPAAGGPPMDPATMGGMPPPGDPAAMGMPPPDMGMPPPDMGMPPPPDAGGDVSPAGEPYMKITPTQLSKLFKQFAEVFKSVLGIQSAPGQAPAAPAPAANLQQDTQLAELNAKLDALIHG